MDPEALVKPRVHEGRDFLAALDASGVPVEAAAWVQRENGDWRLVVVTSLVDAIGPLRTYELVQSALEGTATPCVELDALEALSPNEPGVADLIDAARQEGPGETTHERLAVRSVESSEALVYPISELTYQRSLFRSLQKAAEHAHAVLRHTDKVFGISAPLDFVIDNGRSRVAVEAKRKVRPGALSQVDAYARELGSMWQVLLVYGEGDPGGVPNSRVRTCRWRDADDDEELRARLRGLIAQT